MTKKMAKASELEPTRPPKEITQEQRELIDKLEAIGFNASNVEQEEHD